MTIDDLLELFTKEMLKEIVKKYIKEDRELQKELKKLLESYGTIFRQKKTGDAHR